MVSSMCPKRLPEPANAGPQAGGRRASLARRAEHARSHGTAGSAAGEFCYLPFDPRLIYAAMACNMPQLKLIICALTLSFFQSIRAKRPLVPCVEAALRKGANVDQACYAPCSMPREESPSSRRIFTGALTSSHAPTLLFARTKAGVKWQVTRNSPDVRPRG